MIKKVNANVDIERSAKGAVVTATKIDQKQKSAIRVRAITTHCSRILDPVETTLFIREGTNTTRETFGNIPPAEHFVKIQNGDPGLRKVQIIVNGKSLPPKWLQSNAVRFLDLEEAMTESKNIITVIANGRPGSRALFIVSDIPLTEDEADISAPQHLIQWEPHMAWPDHNMHWGR